MTRVLAAELLAETYVESRLDLLLRGYFLSAVRVHELHILEAVLGRLAAAVDWSRAGR